MPTVDIDRNAALEEYPDRVRQRWAVSRTTAGCAVIALLVLIGCTATQPPSDSPSPGAPAGTVTSPPPSDSSPGQLPVAPTGTAGSVEPTALPVYYVGDTAVGFRLYREFHRVPTADPASDAVREMLARDSGIDPDYLSYWPVGTQLRGPVRHAGGLITVDLTAQARTAQFGAELAKMTVQQLVYTVQGALRSTDPVRILVEGERVDELWGHVSTGNPIYRADPYAIRALVQINEPAHGAQVRRSFTVTGEAAAFEANVLWEVLRDGTVVRSGYTTAAEGQRFSAFSFPLTLEAGEYLVRVVEDSGASPGEGRPPFEDTKWIRVSD